MNIIDRFTRDRFSRYLWSGLTVVCLGLMLLANQGQQRALDRIVTQAEDRAVLYANTLIYDNLTGPDVSDPSGLDGPKYRELYVAIQANMFTDDRNARVRIYQPDGTLIFSTDERFRIGQLRVIDDPDITAASGGKVVTRLTTAPFTFSTTGGGGERTDLLQTFVPLRTPDRVAVLGAVEIDQFYDQLKKEAQSPWRQLQILFLILALFSLVMTILSFRRPLHSVGTLPPAAGEGPADDLVGGARRKEKAVVSTGDADRVAVLERELASTKAALAEAQDRATQAGEAYRRIEAKAKEPAGVDPETLAVHAAAIAELERRVAAAEARAAEAEQTVTELRTAAAAAPTARPESVPAAPRPAPHVVSEPPAGPPSGSEPARQPQSVPAAPSVPAPPPDIVEPAAGSEDGEDDMAAKLSPAANDLRARLARTAALKKLGHDHVTEDDEP